MDLLAFPDRLGFSECQGHFQSSFIICKQYETQISSAASTLCSCYGEHEVGFGKYLFGLAVRRRWANGLRAAKTFVLDGTFLSYGDSERNISVLCV